MTSKSDRETALYKQGRADQAIYINDFRRAKARGFMEWPAMIIGAAVITLAAASIASGEAFQAGHAVLFALGGAALIGGLYWRKREDRMAQIKWREFALLWPD